MRRLLALIGLIQLVYTEDFDGDIRLKMVHHRHPFSGGPWVHGIGLCGCYQLRADGSIVKGYVKRWTEWPHNRRKGVAGEEA